MNNNQTSEDKDLFPVDLIEISKNRAREKGIEAEEILIAMETAIAKAGDPVTMAGAFSHAIISGSLGRKADPMEPREMASPSTPVFGKAFLE